MVALLGLLDALDIRIELLFVCPGRAVDALELLVPRITAPVGTGQLGEFERLEKAGVGYVRPPAHVHVLLMVVQAHRLFVRHVVNQTQLVVLGAGIEYLDRFVARRHLFDDVVVLRDQFLHARFDGGQVFGCEGTLVGNVVIEAVFDDRADDHLRARVELLDGMADQVRARMPDDLQPFLVLGRDDVQCGIVIDEVTGIDEPPVDLARDGVLRQTGADRLCNLQHGYRMIECSAAAILQRDRNRHRSGNRAWKRVHNASTTEGVSRMKPSAYSMLRAAVMPMLRLACTPRCWATRV